MALRLKDQLVGQVVDGRYEVLSRIAAGGMATVYLAADARLGRQVALKVMHPHLAADEVFVDRFAREARSAARLSHPGVVGVYDQGSEGGTVYLAMEHVPGRTLRDVLTERGALSAGEALAVATALLDALASAHRSDLVHRDVKPENILVGLDGRLRVADFGLARAASASTTAASVLIGTVAYLAPELVTQGRADARVDVYAVGVVLFELLTGSLPFAGDVPAQVAFAHVADDVPPPSSRQPHLPVEVDELVQWATARDPQRRPRDAGELLEAVRHVRESLPPDLLGQRPERVAAPAQGRGRPVDRREHVLALPIGEALEAEVERTGQLPPVRDVPPSPRRSARTEDGSATTTRRVEAPPADGDRPAGRRRWRLAALAAALVVLLTAGGFGWAVVAGPLERVPVPRVVTSSVDDARQTLTARELTARVSEVFDEQAPAGQVVGTRPPAGTSVRTGTRVELVVSRGPELFAVPDLAGQTREAADASITSAGLAVGAVAEEFSEDVPAGAVVSQQTPVGEQLRGSTPVDFTVSKGRQPIEVPEVADRAQADAERAVTDAGLVVGEVTRERSETVPAGAVVRAEPDDGQLFRGDAVDLVVSDGPPLVAVPGVVGQQLDAARGALQAAGFQVGVENVLGGFFGTVRSQSVAPGQEVPKGSTVVLTVV